MTDPEIADATDIEPITPEIVAKIIEKERQDAFLRTMRGQTALNGALSLQEWTLRLCLAEKCFYIRTEWVI
jgi:carbamoyl-phosphate synthase large subunit